MTHFQKGLLKNWQFSSENRCNRLVNVVIILECWYIINNIRAPRKTISEALLIRHDTKFVRIIIWLIRVEHEGRQNCLVKRTANAIWSLWKHASALFPIGGWWTKILPIDNSCQKMLSTKLMVFYLSASHVFPVWHGVTFLALGETHDRSFQGKGNVFLFDVFHSSYEKLKGLRKGAFK